VAHLRKYGCRVAIFEFQLLCRAPSRRRWLSLQWQARSARRWPHVLREMPMAMKMCEPASKRGFGDRSPGTSSAPAGRREARGQGSVSPDSKANWRPCGRGRGGVGSRDRGKNLTIITSGGCRACHRRSGGTAATLYHRTGFVREPVMGFPSRSLTITTVEAARLPPDPRARISQNVSPPMFGRGLL
jgi:hypothetical protein